RVSLLLYRTTYNGFNSAQHLWVARTNLRFFVPDFGVAVARNEEGMFLFSRHWHRNIGRDPVAVDDLLTRGVILRSGKTQSRPIGQLQNILYRSFPKSGFADKNGPF